ncbi:hypothetical protein WUBG_11879, partial [Wuchereria bancrofti]
IGDSQRLRFDQQHQRILRHKQQLHEQQTKRELQKRKNEEKLRYEQQQQQQQHGQRYPAVYEEHQFSMDDEPDEKWKFYQYSRRL